MMRFALCRLVLAALLALTLAPLGAVDVSADTEYTVQAGDTLSGIAADHGTTVSVIVEENGIDDPRAIRPGQKLIIPGTSDSSAAPTSSAATGSTRLRPDPNASPDARLSGRSGSSGAGTRQSAPARSAEPAAGPGSILADRRVVTYYGNPWSDLMGILGELSPSGLVRELNAIAAEYEAVSDKPVQPAIHLITTVAQADAGPDGMYRARMPESMIEEYSQLAADNGMLLFLDVQVGLSDVPTEIEPLRKYLERPHVHLALDPEFDMDPGDLPGRVIGTMNAEDINYATNWLADIVAQNNLPNKILIIHQFNRDMLRNKADIQDNPLVDIVIDMDGFGGRQAKLMNYDLYAVQETPEFTGIKLFYQQDVNLLTPADLMGLDSPPDLIIYQ